MNKIISMLRFLVCLLIFVGLSCQAGQVNAVIPDEKVAIEPPKTPLLGDYTVFEVDVEELSGLCLTADKDALLACGDQGVVKKISFTGEVETIWEHNADMEGITLHPHTKDIYIAVEGAQKVYKLNSPSYNTYSTIFYVQEAVDGNFGNSGLEGITYYKDDILFIGSQKNAESVCVDHTRSCIWIGSDEYPSKLYRFSLQYL